MYLVHALRVERLLVVQGPGQLKMRMTTITSSSNISCSCLRLVNAYWNGLFLAFDCPGRPEVSQVPTSIPPCKRATGAAATAPRCAILFADSRPRPAHPTTAARQPLAILTSALSPLIYTVHSSVASLFRLLLYPFVALHFILSLLTSTKPAVTCLRAPDSSRPSATRDLPLPATFLLLITVFTLTYTPFAAEAR